MAADVKRIDHGLAQIIERTNALAASGVKVGIQSGAGQHEGTDLLDIAIWNHFGTRNEDGTVHIPARPFMTNSAIAYQGDIGKIMAHLAQKVREGASPDEALATLGEQYQAMLRHYVQVGGGLGGTPRFAANAPATVKRKGSDKPLIDTGALVGAIRWEREK